MVTPIKGVSEMPEGRSGERREKPRKRTEETPEEIAAGNQRVAELQAEAEARNTEELAQAAEMRGELAVQDMDEVIFDKMIKESSMPQMTFEQFKDLPNRYNDTKTKLDAAVDKVKSAGFFARMFNSDVRAAKAQIEPLTKDLDGISQVMEAAKNYGALEGSRGEEGESESAIDRKGRQRERHAKAQRSPGFGKQ